MADETLADRLEALRSAAEIWAVDDEPDIDGTIRCSDGSPICVMADHNYTSEQTAYLTFVLGNMDAILAALRTAPAEAARGAWRTIDSAPERGAFYAGAYFGKEFTYWRVDTKEGAEATGCTHWHPTLPAPPDAAQEDTP